MGYGVCVCIWVYIYIWVLHYLVCWACCQNELAVWVEGQAIDLCCMCIHSMAGLGGVVGTRVPATCQRERAEKDCWKVIWRNVETHQISWVTHNHHLNPFSQTDILRFVLHTKPLYYSNTITLTSWASGHRPRSRRETRAAGARRRPPPLRCGLWRWSWRPPPCPLWAPRWCPTGRSSVGRTETQIVPMRTFKPQTHGYDNWLGSLYAVYWRNIFPGPGCQGCTKTYVAAGLTWSSEALSRQPDRLGFQESP